MAEDDASWADIGRRAIACKGWRWMAGMMPIGGSWRAAGAEATESAEAMGLAADAVPDFRDPATLGCLQFLARKSQPGGGKLAVIEGAAGGVVVVEADPGAGTIQPLGEAATEAEAWVTILEVA